MSDLKEIIREGYEMIIAGDTNFECDLRNDGFSELQHIVTL